MPYILQTTGIEAPSGFNGPDYDAVNASMWTAAPGSANLRMFASAWNAVAYRYRAALEYEQRFTDSIRRSQAPAHEERFAQDHDLFGFVVSAVSAIECFCFALNCVGSEVSPALFPMIAAKDLKFSPQEIAKRFRQAYPNDPLTVNLSSALATPEFTNLWELRIFLFHRGTPPRQINVGGTNDGATIPVNPRDLSSDWSFTLPLDGNLGGNLRAWLIVTMAELVAKTKAFATGHL